MGGQKKSQVSVRFVFLIAVMLLSFIVVSAALNPPVNETNPTPIQNYSFKPNFSLSLFRQTYTAGEPVNISISPPDADFLIRIIGPVAEYVLDFLEFTPVRVGNYTVLATLSMGNWSENLSAGFEVINAAVVHENDSAKQGSMTKKRVSLNVFDEATEKAKIEGKDRKSTRLNSSHTDISRMPSSA